MRSMAGPSSTRPLRAATVLSILEDARITHVVGLPDNASAPLLSLLVRHDAIRWITVTREAEAFAIAAGIWLGGRQPFVVVQNTGLLESGDALRGTATRMGAPIPILVTGRGYATLEQAGLPVAMKLQPEILMRPDIDSAALFTEPTLAAWGVPVSTAGSEADAELVRSTIARAREEQRPVALVLTRPLAA